MANNELNGIKILENAMLPPMTMMVSPDLFAKLTDTPEQAEAKHHAVLAHFELFNQLMARHVSKSS